MFKKQKLSILLTMIFSFHTAFAHVIDDYEHNPDNLFVQIQNLGSENCKLERADVSQGKLFKNSNPIPKVLNATGETYRFVLNGAKVETTLKYSCGKHKIFSLYMKQYFKNGHIHKSIDSKFLNAVDVFETHKKQYGMLQIIQDHDMAFILGDSGKISWQITQ
ncbi:MAG: hypothetical protein NXI01_04270 [Gammaproteobacteria bacterium]|nr:hypothetical protein [Gammaproteobacteria bacterium]